MAPSVRSQLARAVRLLTLSVLTLIAFPLPLLSQTAPGGFIEKASSNVTRPRLSAADIQTFMPAARGPFTFPAPYNTKGIRLTTSGDCGGADCVRPVGYSYWRNMNNHVGSDTMYIFLGFPQANGGPTLFSYNKVTDQVTKVGPLFDPSSIYSWHDGQGWYFSATQPTKLYVSNNGPELFRYDVITKTFETVLDVRPQFGADKYIFQVLSSNDDKVHSFTLKQTGSWATVGCGVYREDTGQFRLFPQIGAFPMDECHIDKSGRWLMIEEDVDGAFQLDQRVIDLTGAVPERIILDQNGGVGHADEGYGYTVGTNNYSPLANTVTRYQYDVNPIPLTTVSYNTDWFVAYANHITHSNAQASVPPEQQYACGSNASDLNGPRGNELVCFRLDASQDVLVVADVMTDMSAAGGGDSYSKMPKANLDVTGQYLIWTSNIGTNRLDAFIVKVPAQLLTGAADATPPTVALTAPALGATVSGTTTVSADASDNVGVAGVQFQLDGVPLGAEDTTNAYAVSWNSTTIPNGLHTLTAVARDAAGNLTTSSAVTVTVSNLLDTTPPVISAVASSGVTATGATITWTTNEASDSQVEYGPTTAYGSSTILNASMVTAHSQALGGLAAGTLYHYRVKSRDAAGNLATSGDVTFTTVAGGPAPGFVGYWKFDEGSGTTAADASGNGNTGTLVNGPAWTAGKLSGALSFDGVNDYVRVPHKSALNAYPVTVVSWVKTASATGLKGIVNKYSAGSQNGYQVFMNGGNLCAWYFKNASNYVWDGSSCTLMTPGYNDSQWHQVVLVVDAAGGKLYVDGSLKASLGWTGTPGAATTTQNPNIGRYPGAASSNLPGLVDDVRVYNYALSATEVAALYSAAKPSSVEGVAWINPVNVTATGNSLQKTSGCDGCADAGASSQQQIASGDGYVEFTASEAQLARTIGFSNGSAGIKFAISLGYGWAEVREDGAYQSNTTLAPGDVFRIAVESGAVKYYKNGALLFTSTVAPSYPLRVDASLLNLNGTVTNAMISR